MSAIERRLPALLAGGRARIMRLHVASQELLFASAKLTLPRTNRLHSVQIMRVIAALSVMIGHIFYEARGLDPTGVSRQLADMRLWTAGVDLFFVISGFIMMWTFGHRFGEAGAGRAFLVRRLARIVPSYWIFTALMVLAIFQFGDRLDAASFTPEHALLSFLFIPHLSPHGTIHPILALGWTLVYEMFFYVMFAAVLGFARRTAMAILVASFAMAYVLARVTDVLPISLQLFWGDAVMFEFLLGIAFYFFLSDGRLSAERLKILLALCLFAGLASWWAGIWWSSRFFHFGLPALALFALGYALLSEIKSRAGMVLVLLGEASYALYLSHPFVIEVLKVPFAWSLPATPATGLVFVVASLVAASSFAVLFFFLVERPMTFWLARRWAR